MIANKKEIAAMSIVQERIRENERQLTLDRQSLAHMENSSWRHMDDLHCALGGVTDQEPSHFKRTIRRMKAGLNWDRLVHSSMQLHLDFLELRSQTVAPGLPLEHRS
jgi:hypothetical protein